MPLAEVVLAEPRGFCAGVDRAIEIVERALVRFGAPIYVRHEIVHNTYVVDDLKRKGAVFIENLADVPPGATLVFSAHGVSKAVQDEANSRGPNSQGPPLALDGIFGPRTDAWVHAFQAAIAGHVIGFMEDGIVGPLTWSLLVTGEKPDPLYQSPR